MEFRKRRQVDANKPTRFYSDRQEKAVAKAVGGKQTKNSGATMWQKGDTTDATFLYECKTCVKDQKSFTIQKAWIDKNRSESLFMNLPYSAVVFNFGPNSKENFYVLDEQTFLLMKEALERLERKGE